MNVREETQVARMTVRMNTEARQEKIVRAALETIAEYGIQGATISRIAKGAGITPAALYSHFENREAILLAALDTVYEQILDSFRSSSNPDPVQRLREICEHHAEKVGDQEKSGHAHLFLEFVASAPEQGLRDALREKELATAAALTSIVRELGQQGGLPPGVEPETIAWLIAGWAWTGDVASLMGVTSVWYPKVSTHLLDLILKSISNGSIAGGNGSASSRLPAVRTEETVLNGAISSLDEAAVDGLSEGAVFTVEETAHILKVSSDVIDEMVRQRQIASLRLGDETRIPRRALVAYLRGVTVDELDELLERRALRAMQESK